MCIDPASISLGAVLSGIGTAVSAVGTFAGASAQASAAKAAAQQADYNAQVAANNAADARERGAAAQQDDQLRTRARLGQQLNILSERNIDVTTGSPLEMLGDTAMMGKLDELTTRNNAEREARAYETQSINYSMTADQSRASASSYMTAGALGAFGDLATGFGKLKL